MSARLRLVSLGFAALALLGACGGAQPADQAAAVVRAAVQKAGAKDVAGLQALACAGRADELTTLLGLPATLGGALLPGIDMQSVADAIRFDVGGLTVGAAVITGDTAVVPVTGSLKVTFDKAAMRPIVEKVLAMRGTPMSADQLDALLNGLADYGQDVPMSQQIKVVREQGVWKVCPDVPSPSSLPVLPGLPGILGLPTAPSASPAPSAAAPALPAAS